MGKGKFIRVSQFYADNQERLHLSWIAGRQGQGREIYEGTIARPGLALAGFYEHLPDKRIHIFGMAESCYLESLGPEGRARSIRGYLAYDFPCVIFARNLAPDPLFIEIANERGLPVFLCPLITTTLVGDVMLYFERRMAPTILVNGSLVEIDGTGVLLRGDSGIGKSETALALVRRGHALVADDLVSVSRLYGDILQGVVANPNMIGYLELRGVGLINLIPLYGIGCFRKKAEINLVITLKGGDIDWDRTGITHETQRILGVDVPHICIPVAPGRDVVYQVEVAAQELRLRSLGINSAKELDDKIVMSIIKGGGT